MAETKIPLDLILERMAEGHERPGSGFPRLRRLLGELHCNRIDACNRGEENASASSTTRNEEAENKLNVPLLVVRADQPRNDAGLYGRSVVKTFLQEGIDLYMVDWGYPQQDVS